MSEARFDHIDTQLQKIMTALGELPDRVGRTEGRLDKIESELASIRREIRALRTFDETARDTVSRLRPLNQVEVSECFDPRAAAVRDRRAYTESMTEQLRRYDWLSGRSDDRPL